MRYVSLLYLYYNTLYLRVNYLKFQMRLLMYYFKLPSGIRNDCFSYVLLSIKFPIPVINNTHTHNNKT